MKLTKTDRELLSSWGYDEQDIRQIERATYSNNTQYKLNNEPICRDDAIHILGRTTYLSGIARSAFHYSATREVNNGNVVYFDSHKFFHN